MNRHCLASFVTKKKSPHQYRQRVHVRAQREARRTGSEGGDDAGPRDRVLVGNAQRIELAAQVRAGEFLLEAQLRNSVQILRMRGDWSSMGFLAQGSIAIVPNRAFSLVVRHEHGFDRLAA